MGHGVSKIDTTQIHTCLVDNKHKYIMIRLTALKKFDIMQDFWFTNVFDVAKQLYTLSITLL